MPLVPIRHRYNATAGVVPLAANLPARELAINTATGKVYTKTDGGVIVQITEPASKSILIDNPTATENRVMFFTRRALKLVDMRSVVKGTSPSVTFKVNYGTDVSVAGTAVVTAGTTVTSTTTGLSTTSFNQQNIPAGAWVWLTTSAVSGTITMLHVTLLFD